MPFGRPCRRPPPHGAASRAGPSSAATTAALVAVLAVLAILASLFGPLRASAQARVADTSPGMPVPAAVAGRSLVLPGWGQHALGQRRSWAYLAVEAALWAYWADRRAAAGDARDAYRDLAWSQARLASGSRADGDWAYYETLEEWTRSGAFDADPALTGVQPEEDPTTFNGYVWGLARGQFLPGGGDPDPGDPRYAQALAYYQERAYAGTFLWDWSGKADALARYKALIRESDARFHRATTTLGAVLANHLLSATDAFLSARLPGEARLRVARGSALGRTGWTVGLTLAPAR